MKTKTKKIKIITLLILLVFAIMSVGVLVMWFNTISYAMEFNAPSRIIVYYNSEVGNQVYEPNSEQYNTIYSSIRNSYKQPILKTFVNGELNKDIIIEQTESSNVDFNGIKVNFVYNSPQAVKYKTKLYYNNHKYYWYQNLIFTISDVDDFQYNQIAIIPPINDLNYINQYTYSLNYKVYSNLGKTYNTLIKYFK